MKRTLPLLLVLGCLLATVQAAAAQAVDIYSRPRKAERSRTYDALHYRIQLRFDEQAKSFWGENTITLTPLHDGFTECVLDAETFTVSAVTDEAGRALDFEQSPHQVRVRFPRAYAYGDTLAFTVAYHAENVDVDAEAFGMSASYDLGLDFKDETPENPRLINTLSFPEAARHWFPGYDHPNDRFVFQASNTIAAIMDSSGLMLGNAARGSARLKLDLGTEDIEIVNAGSAGATEQDWIEGTVGGVTGYLSVFSSQGCS